nr:MAG TPA: hypothetical protein [Caudoviricetes sp.]
MWLSRAVKLKEQGACLIGQGVPCLSVVSISPN